MAAVSPNAEPLRLAYPTPHTRIRAGKACQRCHEKKIKCDLQFRKGPNADKCQNCLVAQGQCQLRESHRGRRKQHPPPPPPAPQPATRSPVYERRVADASEALSACGRDASLVDSSDVSLVLPNPGADPAVTLVDNHPTPAPELTNTSTEGERNRHTSNATGPPGVSGTLDGDFTGLQSVFTPGGGSAHSGQPRQHASYLGETGYMQIFTGDASETDVITGEPLLSDRFSTLDQIPHTLLDSYVETYFKYVHVWCPVLDRATLQSQAQESLGSPMLRHALALCGTLLRPPLISHPPPINHYKRAKGLFYADYEDNPISQISAIMMFYWYSPGPSNFVNLDNNWWWIGTAIRLAQEIGLQREPTPGQKMCPGETPGLRRRIWWTLFARDRIVALAQGRPCIIDQDYCDLKMVSVEDFPDSQDLDATIFVHWVQIWDIAGQINKELHRRKDVQSKASLARKMINWIRSLPPLLQLPFGDRQTLSFNRDVYYLHLGYLTVVILFHLTKNEEGAIPKASRSAIAAASCSARIFNEFLARGSIRFMACDAVWYVTVALLALLHARRIADFTSDAEKDITLLRVALKQLAVFWYSGRLFDRGIERLLETEPSTLIPSPYTSMGNVGGEYLASHANLDGEDGNGDSCWMDYFPYMTTQTSPLIAVMMVNNSWMMPLPDIEWPVDVTSQLQGLFSGVEGFNFNHW